MIKDNIIYYYLFLRNYINVWYWTLRRKISNIKELIIIRNGKPVGALWSFYFIRVIDKWINFLELMKLYSINFRNYWDIKTEKAQVVKNYENGDQTIIIDSNLLGKKNLSLHDIGVFLDHNANDKDESMVRNVFLKFEIYHDEKQPICMKDYAIKYKDSNEFHHHTIGNIIAFNDLDVHPDSEIRIRFMKNGAIISRTYSLEEIRDSHINSVLK